MACHEQAEGASNGYRAWIRTMNNASKGRNSTERIADFYSDLQQAQPNEKPGVSTGLFAACWLGC
jgi:hypothetical protein